MQCIENETLERLARKPRAKLYPLAEFILYFRYFQGSTSSTSSVGSTSSNSSMEVSTRNGLNGKATPTCSSTTPGTPNKHVNFGGSGGAEEKKREKFLTAKYGAHQMALIRKRLRVEMWMYERLQEIYGAVSPTGCPNKF